MTRTYEGLKNAIETAKNIIMGHDGYLEWEDYCKIFCNDPIIELYYYEVTDALIAGRLSVLLEQK